MITANKTFLGIPQLVVLALGTFAHGVDRHLLSGLMPAVSADLQVTPSTFGAATAVFAAVFAVASPVIAALTERWERRVLLGSAMLLFLLGIVFQATATQLPVLLFGSMLIGLSGSMYLPAAYSSAGIHSSTSTRARSLAFVLAGASLSLVVGVPLAVWVGQHYGWRWALWMLGASAVVATLPLPILPALNTPPRVQGRWEMEWTSYCQIWCMSRSGGIPI